MKKTFTFTTLIFICAALSAQNIGINTDGSAAETGVMLDVKGTSPKATTGTQNALQVKSNDAAYSLKLRLILGTNVTSTSMYGGIEVADSTGAGTRSYRSLVLQPNGGNVGIGTIAPGAKLSFQDLNNGANTADGITWYSPSPTSYGIFRSAGAWSGNYQQLTFAWQTGIVIDGGSAYGLSGTVLQPTAGNVGIGTTTPKTKLDVNGSVSHREGGAIALANGANNNIALPGTTPFASFYRITGPTAAFSISGIVPPASCDGMILTLYNTVAFPMTVVNQATSTAANQIITTTGGNITSNVGSNILQLQYNAALSRWIVLNSAGFDNNWRILGNAGTVDGTNFIGTTDDIPLNLRINNITAGRITRASVASLAANSGALTFLGYYAGYNNSRNYCTGIGDSALWTNAGTGATAVGYNAGYWNGGSRFTAIGYKAGYNNSASENTALGWNAMNWGSAAGTTSNYANTAVGSQALGGNPTGNSGFPNGSNDGRVGGNNTAIGCGAMQNVNLAGPYNFNTACGFQAMGNETGNTTVSGNYNTSLGALNLCNLTTGSGNTAVGHGALKANSTGLYNTAIGINSLSAVNTGELNLGVGGYALNLTTTGTGNTAVGPTVKRWNPLLGGFWEYPFGAGTSNTTGNYNTFLGYYSNCASGALTNANAIGSFAQVSQSNSIVLGSTANAANTFYNGSPATSNTDVGIGISAPTAVLHVQRNQNAKTRIKIINSTAGTSADAELYIQRADANIVSVGIGDPTFGGANPIGFTGAFMWTGAPEGMTFRSDNATGSIRLVTNGTGIPTEYMRLDAATGNVGIRCTAPTQALYVTGNVYATGTVLGGQAACSDVRWKKDFVQLENSLEKILKLSAYYYKFRTTEFPDKKFSEGHQLGMKAQEVEKLYPELIFTDQEGFKYLDYGRLTPILVEAIKEQQAMIERLRSDNDVLKANSEARIEKLEGEMKLLLQTSKAEAKK